MSNPAPGALEHVRAFVNTRDVDDDTDALSGPEELAGWLAEHELLAGARKGGPVATAADVRRAVQLREALRAHLRAHHGEPLQPGAAEILDAAARRAALTVRFRSLDETSLEPRAEGVDGALGRLLALVAVAIEEGTWRRLKVCPADHCQWAFYDESRNRSATWCDMKVCGNRAKVRGFRERTRSSPGDRD